MKIIIPAILVITLLVAMLLAPASNLPTASTPLNEAYAAPEPSDIVVTREPARPYLPTDPAPRTPSPLATDPAPAAPVG